MASSESQPSGPPPHVVLVVENLPVPFDRRVWQEAQALRDAGFRVSTLSPTGPGCEALYEARDGVAMHRFVLPAEGQGAAAYLREYGTAFFQVSRLLASLRRRGPIDLVQVCNPPEIFFPLAPIVRAWGGKFVFDQHDLSPELYESKFGRRDAFYRLLRFCERRTLRTADLVVATNESIAALAQERAGVSADQVVVVRNGPDLRRLYRVPAVPALKQGRAHLCAYVGMMGSQDGIDLLLRAVAHVHAGRRRHDVQFVLAGDGPVLNDMRALAAQLGVAEVVTFAGRLGDAALRELLSTADVCVVPDEVNDLNDKLTMIKIMEYMAMQRPIVLFDMTESRRSAAEAGLYARANDVADLGDKLLAVIDDPALGARLGALGRARIDAELSWPHQAAKLVGAYRELLGWGG